MFYPDTPTLHTRIRGLSEQTDADVRIATRTMDGYGYPRKKKMEGIRQGTLSPVDIKEEDRDYYLERRYPAFRKPGAQRRGIPCSETGL